MIMDETALEEIKARMLAMEQELAGLRSENALLAASIRARHDGPTHKRQLSGDSGRNDAADRGTANEARPSYDLVEAQPSRRALLSKLGTVAAAGAGLALGAEVFAAQPAGAATGVMLFGANNDAGTDPTSLTSSSGLGTLTVENTAQTFAFYAKANAPTGASLYVMNESSGGGVNSFCRYGPGLFGQSPNSLGVYGVTGAKSALGPVVAAVVGDSNTRAGVAGISDISAGVVGASGAGSGLGDYNTGVRGEGSAARGVSGYSVSNVGVLGQRGRSSAINGTGAVVGDTAQSGIAGVAGLSTSGPGVSGVSQGFSGLASGAVAGVVGDTNASAVGVAGFSKSGAGVLGRSIGASGLATGAVAGVVGDASTVVGVAGFSASGTGVLGHSATQNGVVAQSDSNGAAAIFATSVASKGRGGLFRGADDGAAISLVPASLATHPTSGQTGDLFVDSGGRLWYCKTGGSRGTWTALA